MFFWLLAVSAAVGLIRVLRIQAKQQQRQSALEAEVRRFTARQAMDRHDNVIPFRRHG